MRTRSSETKLELDKIQIDTVRVSGVAFFVAMVLWLIGFGGTLWMATSGVSPWIVIVFAVITFLAGLYILLALKIAKQWEKAVVLRYGRYRGLRGPGLFWITPIVDTTPHWIDSRVMVTPFSAEKTLTKEAT
jgi:hypothetical protein